MKSLLITLLLLSSVSSFAVCGVIVKNSNYVSALIGDYELESALQKRGYYLRDSSASDIELELDIAFEDMQVHYQQPETTGQAVRQEMALFWIELTDPDASVIVNTYYPETNSSKTYEKGLSFYGGNGARVRRVVRRMIRKIPKCKTKLVN